jgi:CubicO group peptidase (beta-lactamase class C family)
VLARDYGLADVEAGRRVTAETLFSLASVTKSVSAATRQWPRLGLFTRSS